MGSKKSLSDLERVLIDHAADSQVESLVSAGCDRVGLMALLELVFLTDESWKTLAGMDLRAFKAAVKQIKACAGIVERLNCSDLIYRMSVERRDSRFIGVRQPPTLPDRLREYAKAIESLPRIIGPKLKITLHAWKARLVAIVMDQTGKTHDREVSSLIAAVLDNPKYSEKAHQDWRRKHGSIVENEKMRERARRDRPKTPPPLTTH